MRSRNCRIRTFDSGINPVRKSGRYVRANVKVAAGTSFTHAQGIDLVASRAGVR